MSVSLVMALSGAPTHHSVENAPSLPLSTDFMSQADVPWLVSPSSAHRRVLSDCLEYGSFYVFRNSWVSVADLIVRAGLLSLSISEV